MGLGGPKRASDCCPNSHILNSLEQFNVHMYILAYTDTPFKNFRNARSVWILRQGAIYTIKD